MCSKIIRVTTLTFQGHMTSSMTWRHRWRHHSIHHRPFPVTG